MQQTSFDNWVRRRFVYLHEIHCLSLPRLMPAKLIVRQIQGRVTEWRQIIECPDDRTLRLVTAAMTRDRLSYSLRTKARTGWWVKHLAPANKASLTYNLFWRAVHATAGMGVAIITPFGWFRTALDAVRRITR